MEHRSSTVVLHWFLSWACQLGSIAGLFAAVKTSTGIRTTQPVLDVKDSISSGIEVTYYSQTHNVPFELRLDMYRAFITTHFNYCSESWHHCGKRDCAKLEKIESFAL